MRTTGLALGLCILFGAGISGTAEALPGAVHHETRAVARLAQQLGDRDAAVVVSPRHAATPFIDAALDLSPQQLARFVFEARGHGDRIEWKYRAPGSFGNQDIDLVAVDPGDFQRAIEARLDAGKRVWAVAMPGQQDRKLVLAEARCRHVRQEFPFALWKCEP